MIKRLYSYKQGCNTCSNKLNGIAECNIQMNNNCKDTITECIYGDGDVDWRKNTTFKPVKLLSTINFVNSPNAVLPIRIFINAWVKRILVVSQLSD